MKKTIFDHITHLTTVNDAGYYENMSEFDKKTYNSYMINRFLSMNQDWIGFVNEIQMYSQQLKENGIHKIYNEILPKRKVYLKYIKASNSKKYDEKCLDIIMKEYEVGSRQAKEYYDVLRSNLKLKDTMLILLRKHGIQEDEYKSIIKNINE